MDCTTFHGLVRRISNWLAVNFSSIFNVKKCSANKSCCQNTEGNSYVLAKKGSATQQGTLMEQGLHSCNQQLILYSKKHQIKMVLHFKTFIQSCRPASIQLQYYNYEFFISLPENIHLSQLLINYTLEVN